MNKFYRVAFGISAAAASVVSGCSDNPEAVPTTPEALAVPSTIAIATTTEAPATSILTFTTEALPDSCSTPYAEAMYGGDPAATQDQKTWTIGALAIINLLPPNAVPVAAFKYDDAWHDSLPLLSRPGNIGFKIGNGPLDAGIKFVIDHPASLAECSLLPDVTFSEEAVLISSFSTETAAPVWK